jgi:hypothetical protein
MPELNTRINNDTWCVDRDGNVSRNGTILCGHEGLDDQAATVRYLLHRWREMQRVHHHHSEPVDVSKIGYVMPDYTNPGAYYVYPQPLARPATENRRCDIRRNCVLETCDGNCAHHGELDDLLNELKELEPSDA